MPGRTDLTGKFACRLCRHDQYEHNLIVGCPHCRCAATPGEAGSTRFGKEYSSILPPGQYEHEWQRPRPEEPKTKIDLEPEVHYLVAERRWDVVQARTWYPFPTQASAQHEADCFNDDEAENARLERRPVKVRYFVIKAITTYTTTEVAV